MSKNIERTGVDQANQEEPVYDWLSNPFFVAIFILNATFFLGLFIWGIYAWCVKIAVWADWASPR